MRVKLTPELIAMIEQEISEGNYIQTVCRAHDINHSTYYKWKARGERESSGIYHNFYEAMERATAKAEQRYLGVIKDAANSGTWYAAAWWLERRYPERWGKRDRVDVTSGGQPIQTQIDLKKLTDDELKTLEKIVGGAVSLPAHAGTDTDRESQA